MITIRSVTLDPPIASGKPFIPVVFDKGINLIVGEKSSEEFAKSKQSKMNSVGKSLLVEMINFCLFKDFNRSRLSRIPSENLSTEVRVCLALEYEDESTIKQIIIKRPVNEGSPIEIVVNENISEFQDVNQAQSYIEKYFLIDEPRITPSLRQLISILIRDEKYGYSGVLEPQQDSAMQQYNERLLPHVYMFGFSLEGFKSIGGIKRELTAIATTISNLRKEFAYRNVKESDVRSYINELESKVERLDVALNELRPAEGLEQAKHELETLQVELNDLIAKKTGKQILAQKIKSMPAPEKVDLSKIRKVYDNYKNGLGELVERTFEDVMSFRAEIEDFQNQLMGKKLKDINKAIADLDREIESVDGRISALSGELGYKEALSSLGDALLSYSEKSKELETLRAAYLKLEDEKVRKAQLTLARDKIVNDIETEIVDLSDAINSFENDVKEIHFAITGDKHCHFRLAINRKALSKQFLDFDYRIDFDGGYAIDRAKIFIYDTLLMLNKYTKKYHPGFLIHDNAFAGAGIDDMIKGLNYLNEQHGKAKSFQYIFTINKDEYEAYKDAFSFDSEALIKRELTREKPLLNASYREI